MEKLETNLENLLDGLTVDQEQYVWARIGNLNAKIPDLCEELNLAESTFYKRYPPDERDRLDEIARMLYRDKRFRALHMIDDEVVQAVEVLKRLMVGAKSEFVQMQSAVKFLEYALGTPTQRVDVTSGGEKLQVKVTYADDDARNFG